MPNWCVSEMAVYTKKDTLGSLEMVHTELKKIVDENDKSTWDLFKVFKTFEPTWSEDKICNSGLYIRGSIIDLSDIYDMKGGGKYFKVVYESAWESMIEGWEYILKKYDLEQVTIAEECGCNIFINTDKKGLFFTANYFLYSYINDDYIEERFETKQQVVDYINQTMFRGMPTKLQTFGEVQEYIEKFNKNNEDEDWYIYLEEYSDD